MGKVIGAIYFEADLDQASHDEIERDDGRYVISEDDGRRFKILPGGTFNGRTWTHRVIPAPKHPAAECADQCKRAQCEGRCPDGPWCRFADGATDPKRSETP